MNAPEDTPIRVSTFGFCKGTKKHPHYTEEPYMSDKKKCGCFDLRCHCCNRITQRVLCSEHSSEGLKS